MERLEPSQPFCPVRPSQLPLDPSKAGEWNRRKFLRASLILAAGTTFSGINAAPLPTPLLRSPLPGGKGSVARVGVGTWQTFDVGSDPARRAPLAEVLRVLAATGADVVDTSPMYGSSEAVLGDLGVETGLRSRLFLATKVWTSGATDGELQMQESLRLLRTDHVELMQIHNLVDWRVHLKTLRTWKESGRARLIGVTHFQSGAFGKIERILKSEALDFVQLPFSLEEPEAGNRILPLCADRGLGFLANRPFGGGEAFARVRGKPLPTELALDVGISSWAQFLLKWILGHAAVTCAIPGTGNPNHLLDNLGGARGVLPDAMQRERMQQIWRAA